MRIVSFLFAVLMTLQAAEGYPELFNKMGTPLFEGVKVFERFAEHPRLESAIAEYRHAAKEVVASGKAADASQDKAMKMGYLKALRQLQKQYDSIDESINAELLLAMRKNDYPGFSALVQSGYEGFYKRQKLQEKIFLFYTVRRDQGQIPLLDQRIRSDKAIEKVYSPPLYYEEESVTSVSSQRHAAAPTAATGTAMLITRPGCPYCVKAKNFLRRNGIRFREYDSQSAIAQRTMRQYNVTGVPFLRVGERVVRGYSDSAYGQIFGLN